jgi:hypothetical protein
MAFYFVSTFAIAQTPTKQPGLRLSRTKNLHFAKATFPGFSAEDLLKQPVTADKVPLRRFDLMPLMENKPLDWDLEDGIESVQLVLMKVKDLARDGRVQIEVPAKSNMALHEYALEHFGEQNPLSSGGFSPVQAKINIRFHPENGHGRGKVLPVKISMPNGCDLRSRTDKERLIGVKYLKRWGLLEEVQE